MNEAIMSLIAEPMRSKSQQEIISLAYSSGFEYERKFGNCPQCAIAALQDIFTFITPAVFTASFGLSGGVARCGDGTCGALSGSIIVIGALFGRDREHFDQGGPFKRTAELGKLVHDRFIEEYGSITCRDVQKKIMGRSFYMWNPDDMKAFEAAGGHQDKCPDVVGKAAMWTAEILLNA